MIFFSSGKQQDHKKKEVIEMACHQEEADTRLVFHLSTLPSNSNAVIRSSATDVMAVLLGNIHKLKPDVNVWMQTGLHIKNTLRYIDISRLFDWGVTDGKYVLRWYTGEMVPSTIHDWIIQKENMVSDFEEDDELLAATDESDSAESEEE